MPEETRDAWLTEEFERRRTHLRGVAYRLLGSTAEAEDAVQEAWIRLHRADATSIDNLGGWLTTVVARISLDQLRSRTARRERLTDTPDDGPAPVVDPADQAVLADSVGIAMLVVLDRLTPGERIAFVLHDLFGVGFDEIAGVVATTPVAARQLASRARRKVRGAEPVAEGDVQGDIAAQRAVVDAFLAASRGGDLAALLRLLHPDVVLDVDPAAAATGASRQQGADAVAATFAGRARAARPALVDGVPGLVWSRGGIPQVVFDFVVRDGRVERITLLADRDTVDAMDLEML